MKLLQVNTAGGRGASGGIPESVHRLALSKGIDARMVVGRGDQSQLRMRVGNVVSMGTHLLATRLFDRHGLHSRRATQALIKYAEDFGPDIVHLHNIHGYYLDYRTLMQWIKHSGRQVVWTLHDCWTFTGHCAFPVSAGCSRWVDGCHDCPLRGQYPASWFVDNSEANWHRKQAAFSGLGNVTLVPVSKWVDSMLQRSILGYLPRHIVRNGIDLQAFRPSASKSDSPLVLGVASKWDERKGLQDFVRLRRYLPEHWRIRLIGLTPGQIKELPEGIEGICRINDTEELALNYSTATVFVNPTTGEGDPITKMEALACGTPVVTYNAGGAGEGLTSATGAAVPPGRFDLLLDAIVSRSYDSGECRRVAECTFDMHRNLNGYFALYDRLSETVRN